MDTSKLYNVSIFIRYMLLKKPNITPDEMIEEHRRLNLDFEAPKPERIRNLRYQLCEKYGVKSIDELKLKPNGEINISGLLRRFIAKNPNVTAVHAERALSADGITYTSALFIQSKRQANGEPAKLPKKDKSPIGHIVPDESPSLDSLQSSEPRARLVAKKGRPLNSKNAVKPAGSTAKGKPSQKYLVMEEALDELMNQALALENSDLVTDVRNLRRKVILAGAGVNS